MTARWRSSGPAAVTAAATTRDGSRTTRYDGEAHRQTEPAPIVGRFDAGCAADVRRAGGARRRRCPARVADRPARVRRDQACGSPARPRRGRGGGRDESASCGRPTSACCGMCGRTRPDHQRQHAALAPAPRRPGRRASTSPDCSSSTASRTPRRAETASSSPGFRPEVIRAEHPGRSAALTTVAWGGPTLKGRRLPVAIHAVRARRSRESSRSASATGRGRRSPPIRQVEAPTPPPALFELTSART